jgi:transposase
MDNTGSERAARPPVVGRKNFYGSGSLWSGQLLASMLTILQTGRLHQVDLRGYLIKYLQACAQNGGKAPEDLGPWLPWNYQAQEQALGP